MTIKEGQPKRWLGLVKSKIGPLNPGDTRNVFVGSSFRQEIRKLEIKDDDTVALYDLVGTRLIPTNDTGGVRVLFDWAWREVKRAHISFKTISGSTIFWEK